MNRPTPHNLFIIIRSKSNSHIVISFIMTSLSARYAHCWHKLPAKFEITSNGFSPSEPINCIRPIHISWIKYKMLCYNEYISHDPSIGPSSHFLMKFYHYQCVIAITMYFRMCASHSASRRAYSSSLKNFCDAT